MERNRRTTVRSASATLVGLVLASALVLPGSVVTAGAATVERPEGAGPPVAASGMGTQAALDNPRCQHDDPTYGPYGRFDSTSVGGGPACVKVWKEGADNGGATAQGVTKDRVKVVFVLPNEEQFKSDPVKPVNRASNTTGTYQDGLNDYLIPALRFYETWGRDLEAHFYTSSGSDEQSQRSDIVAIKAMKPFAAANLISGQNLKVLETGLAAAKILMQGYSASYEDSAKQSPYLWGSADNNATAINSAEVLGKQLVGKKAEFGGDDVAGQTRKIGVVSDGSIDDALFVDAFRDFGGKVAATATVPIESDALQAAVPPVITRLKSAGVTTIVMFAGSDAVQTLMETASKQDYSPEWFFTGASYQDIGILARNYPPDQSQHAFGISFINPSTKPDPATEARTDAVTWYWGPDRRHLQRALRPAGHLAVERHPCRGTEPHAEDVQAGPVRAPGERRRGEWPHRHLDDRVRQDAEVAMGRVRDDGLRLRAVLVGPDHRRTRRTGCTSSTRVSAGTSTAASDTSRPTGRRSSSPGSTSRMSINSFPSRPGGPLEYAGDCTDCPAAGGAAQPGAPSDSVVVFEAGGTGASPA